MSDGSDIAYRTSRAGYPLSVFSPSPLGARSFARQRETRNPRASDSRRTISVRILFRIDFGISAGAPETDEARDETTRQEGKGIEKKGGAAFRDDEP